MPASERDYWIADWQADRLKCSQCGGDPKTCGDAGKPWFPQRNVCYSTMELQAAHWRYGELHKDEPFHDGTFTSWSGTRSLAHPYNYADGVTISVSPMDLNPDDDFLKRPEMEPPTETG